MGLEEYSVDLFEFDAFGLVTDGFQETGDRQIAESTQIAFCGACDESQCFLGKSMMSKAASVELCQDKFRGLVGIESGKDDGIGDAGFDVLVDREIKKGE